MGSYLLYSPNKMKITLTLLFVLLNCAYICSQEKCCYDINTKALDVGVYDYSKVKKSKLKVLYGEEARKALAKRIEENQELIDFVGGWLEEQEIISYYPQEDVVLFVDPAITVGVFNLKKIKEGGGDPGSYIYSPSGKYRFSTLDADGMHYYLERKINGEYRLCKGISIRGTEGSFYWKDDDTIHYLQERNRYTDADEPIKYWIGYAAKIKLVKCDN